MHSKSGLLAFIVVLIKYTECAKILGIFPMPGISHYILASKLMKGLVTAGHDVTMISPYEMKDVPTNGNYTDIVLDGFVEQFQKMMASNDLYRMNEQNQLTMVKKLTEIFLFYSNETFYNPKVKQLIKSNLMFDAVILEQFNNDALKVFAYIFDCPLILLSSIGPNAWVNPTVGNPQPVSYAAHLFFSDFSANPSFVNRTKNLFFYLLDYFVMNYYTHPMNDGIIHQAFANTPSMYELFTNVSLVLLNSHTSLYQALPIVPNMVEIGGYFIDPPKKLPQDLQEFLDKATDGVVYFSMGSNLKSMDMPKERKEFILNVFGNLKEKVLWKFEQDLTEKPDNVLIRKWLPQQDILAHPNIKLFITHGGLLSTTEAIYHGIPILAIPVFGDQNTNAARAEANGCGLMLPYISPDFSEDTFRKLINELLQNPKYRENVQRRSKLYHDRPMSPMKTAVYWIEYVIRHKGAPHLRVAGIRLPWYKYFMVDVLGSLVLAIVFIFTILILTFKRLFCRTISPVKTTEKKKTN